ncbi:MAG TPA: RHS repeat-associated core domain-containing protein [Stenotrophomonas sp.]|nr:RHS repeat-associated core domain-containing protein [Stenotrophomonas sp.]
MSTMRMKSGRADFAWMRPGWRIDRWMGRVAACLALFITAGLADAQTVEYIHTDALGSPVATSNASGIVIERQVYEPYGAPISHGPTDGPRFTGHVEDSSTGLINMQQRYYDPGVGQFLSVDPVAPSAKTDTHFNRYRYANSSPQRFTDPDGRVAIVTANKDGSINVNIPATFKGNAASAENIGTLKNQVAALSGTYNINGKETQVNFTVSDVGKETPRAARNVITLTNGQTSGASGRSNAQLGGRKAEIDVTDRFVPNGTGPHELLHLADVDDRYDTITRTPDPAWGNNIMNVVPGKLEDRNMPELMNSRNNIYRSEE